MRRLAVLLLLLASSAHAGEPVDQFGVEHPWRGPAESYRVIDFAAAWCTPCWTTLPKLVALAAEHPDLSVLVIDVDDYETGRTQLIEGLDLELPLLWDEEHVIAEHYSLKALPATFVLDPAGEVIYESLGSGSEEWDAFRAFVEALELQ